MKGGCTPIFSNVAVSLQREKEDGVSGREGWSQKGELGLPPGNTVVLRRRRWLGMRVFTV